MADFPKKFNYIKIKKSILKMKKDELHPSAKLLFTLISILSSVNEANPYHKKFNTVLSRETVEKYLDIKKATISKYTSMLEEEGLVKVDRKYKFANRYTPVKTKEGDKYVQLLTDFVLSRTFNHSQKIFLVSLSTFLERTSNPDLSQIKKSYSDIAEATGLSQRFIAETAKSLSQKYVGDDHIPIFSKKPAEIGWIVNDKAIRYTGQMDRIKDVIDAQKNSIAIDAIQNEDSPKEIVEKVKEKVSVWGRRLTLEEVEMKRVSDSYNKY